MQKTHQKTTDFFSTYRSRQLRKYALSGGIAVFVAFSFVSLINSPLDMNGLMASIANVTDTPHYDADLIMTRQENALTFIFGTRADKVDTVDLTLLGDPSRLHTITSINPDVRIVGQSDMGVYHVSIDMHGRDIAVGTRIAELTVSIDTGTTLSLSDTQFVSGGQRYRITNKGE